MDSLHAIGFYASSGVSLAGGLGVALLPRRDWRGLALAVSGVGLAGVYLSLSAGFAGAVALICYLGCAVIVAAPAYRVLEPAVQSVWRQLGALGAAGLLAVLAYSAFKSDFVAARFYGGAFDTAAVGRLLFEHDALGVEAVAALTLAAAAGGAAVWRLRDRAR
jgi:NADH:ubiquinone oxidoreductase subunit 6 (subunit J)